MKRTVTLFIVLISMYAGVHAQKKVVLEQLRYATPVSYLIDPSAQQSVGALLSELLQKHHHLVLRDSFSLPFVDLNAGLKERRELDFSGEDTGTLHMLIEIAEYLPSTYYLAMKTPAANAADSAQRAKTRTVFRFSTVIADNRNAIVFNNLIDVLVFHSKGPGMGPESTILSVLPKTFLEMMRKVMPELIDPKSDKERLGLAVSPVYMEDNFFMSRLAGQPRHFVSESGSSYQFSYDTAHILRKAEPMYEELQLKGRKATVYPKVIMETIRQADNRSNSDFVFLKQEWRDVIRDRSYLVKLLIQVDPNIHYGTPAQALTGFMPGNIHLLLEGQDTVAQFSIDKYVTDPDKKVYPAKVFNGADSSSMITISNDQVIWPLKYNYVIKGTIARHSFEIRCSGVANRLKELYIDDKLACIAQGGFSPEVFVVFDASLSPEILKQLFVIGFNRFFE